MSNLGWAMVGYLGYFALIGVAVWVTGSGWPLWALFLIPAIEVGRDNEG